MAIKFDELDKRIISAVADGGPINIKGLSAILNISITPLRRRILKLQDAGYLENIRAIDRSKFPHSVETNVRVFLRKKKKPPVDTFVSEVVLFAPVTKIDYINNLSCSVSLLFRDKFEKNDFLENEMSSFSGVEDFESYDILKTIYPGNARLL